MTRQIPAQICATKRYMPHQYKGDYAMNRTRKALAAAVIITAAALVPGHSMAAGDPVVTATCDATVAVGATLHCTVTIDQAGFAPSGQRITYRNPRTFKTINVANESVIPVTFDGTAWQYTYTPQAGEGGRVEVFSVVSACTRLGCTAAGSTGFTVTP